MRLTSAIALISLITVTAVSAAEPEFKGRPLSQWLIKLEPTDSYTASDERAQAIRSIGTNAIPTLLKWISYERKSANRAEDKEQPIHGNRDSPLNAENRAERAVIAFLLLGPEAKPAISELTRLAMKSSDPDQAERCVTSLAYIGPDALPSFLTIVTNGSPRTRFSAIGSLPTFRKDAVAAVPALIMSLGDKNEDVGSVAADVLTRLPDVPTSVVVTALTNALQSPSNLRRMRGARSLMFLHQGARDAVPALRVALKDSDPKVRSAITNALQAIAPEN